MKTNSQLLSYIRDGIHTSDFFNYDGHELEVRPLRSSEIDDAKIKGYKYVNPQLAKLLLNIYIGNIDPKKIRDSYPVDMYKNFDKYYREIDYWIVYHGMKDFMPKDFSIDDVRQMRYVHDIAKYIVGMSTSDTKTLRQFIFTEEGERIATIIHVYNQPLVSSINDMTPLQQKFLFQSDPSKTPKEVELKDIEDLDNFLKQVNSRGRRR